MKKHEALMTNDEVTKLSPMAVVNIPAILTTGSFKYYNDVAGRRMCCVLVNYPYVEYRINKIGRAYKWYSADSKKWTVTPILFLTPDELESVSNNA